MEKVNFYVTDEVVAVEALAISNEFKFERMHTIASILKNKPNIIVTYISSFARPLIPLDIYKDNVIISVIFFGDLLQKFNIFCDILRYYHFFLILFSSFFYLSAPAARGFAVFGQNPHDGIIRLLDRCSSVTVSEINQQIGF